MYTSYIAVCCISKKYFVPLLTLLVCLIRASGTRDATAVDPASAASCSEVSFAVGVSASASSRSWPPEFHDGEPSRPPDPALRLAGEGGGRQARGWAAERGAARKVGGTCGRGKAGGQWRGPS